MEVSTKYHCFLLLALAAGTSALVTADASNITTASTPATTPASTVNIITRVTPLITNVDAGYANEDSSDVENTAEDDVQDYIRQYNQAAILVNEDTDYDNLDPDRPIKPELEVDQAWFTINSTVSYDIEVWAQRDECYKCGLMYITHLHGNTAHTFIVNSTYDTDLRMFRVHPDGNVELVCRFHTSFREKGDYWVFINPPPAGEETACNLRLANDPSIAELPILYVLIGLLGLAVTYVVAKRLFTYFRRATAHKRDSMDVTSAGDHDGGDVLRMGNGRAGKEGDAEGGGAKGETDSPAKRPRLRSLDTFRGLTLILMIFVNYGGGHYWFFEHSPWNGIYVADLVFPWFVFIMGVSINFSFKSMFRKGWSIPRVTWKVVWRAAKLFTIGFMLGTNHYVADLPNVRVFGVLQRLALTYLITALIHFCCTRRFDSHQDKKWALVRDLVLYVPEWVANLALLAVHLGIVYGLPVPGCPTGYVGPGGISDGGKHANCTGGATQYVDSLLLGTEHMYKWPTPQVIYQTTVPFDPEGLLATLNCVFLCFLGVQCGRIILLYQDHKQRIVRFLIWAVALGALGALFTKCSQDDGWIPANKNLWSLSYSLITAAFGYVLLCAIYVITDILNIWQGQPFTYPGMNSIVIYVCHSLFYKTFPVNFVVEEVHWKLLLRCVWGTSIWIMVAYGLYLKKIFIAL